ncbi:MAG: hypothetical protein ISN26_06980 [Betaproteobacteria bacterium AqS2]|uniref:Uncharacterized protein n=1 Tax=Candidatus Amphirhobacter heronislandensis TaxID=1732024 RepID=A0A930UHE0_9GAMM|nr:hypothetical protein [Betaproteobacteria bacterium AqS2]
MTKKFELEFCYGEKEEGFRQLGLSTYKDAYADIVVRELIQNATDAVAKAKRKVTEVTFVKDKISPDDMPARECFERSFAAAKEKSKALGQVQEKGIIETIENQLKRKELDVLWVIDNGIGLDTRNMNDLLAEGNTGTEAGSSGAYGVGHLTAFPASHLRYIVYGGVSKQESIVSGHAILRSHDTDDFPRGSDGYLRKPRKKMGQREAMQFPSAAEVGGIWEKKINHIAEKYKTGSFVCILAFNLFNGEEKDLKEDIFYTAAAHFMPLIYREALIVRYGSEVLDHKNLQEMLESNREKKAARASVGVSGKKFFDLYKNLNDNAGNPINIDLGKSNETAKLYLKSGKEFAPTEIHLYRNGMWITNAVPRNRPYSFGGYAPFNALIAVDNKAAPKAGGLIKMSENPTHIKMSLKSDDMVAKDKERLNEVLQSIQNRIKGEAEKEKEVDVIPSNYFVLPLTPDDKPTPVRRARRRVKDREKEQQTQNKKPRRKGGKISYTPKGQLANIQSSFKIADGKKILIFAEALDSVGQVEVSLVRKSGSDASCDLPEADECIPISFESRKDGSILDAQHHILDSKDGKNRCVGLRLEDVKKGAFELEMEMTPPPSNFDISEHEVEFIDPGKKK